MASSQSGPDKIRIGDLRERIIIQEPIISRSLSGQEVIEWRDVCTVSANLKRANTGSYEGVDGDAILSSTRVIFTIRYRKGLTEKMRIMCNGRFYNIHYIHDDSQEMYIRIVANRVDQGQ